MALFVTRAASANWLWLHRRIVRRIESVTARSSFAIARRLVFVIGDQQLYPLLQLVRQAAKLRSILLCQGREALLRRRKLAQEALTSYPIEEARAIPEVRYRSPYFRQGKRGGRIAFLVVG